MEEMDMVPAMGPTPARLAVSATNHLGRSIDAAVVKQRERDGLTMFAIVGTGLLGLGTTVMLGFYLFSGGTL